MTQWKVDSGKKALEALVKAGLISDASTWNDKMEEPAQNWLVFTLIQRALEKK